MRARVLFLLPGLFCLIAGNHILGLEGSGSALRYVALAILGTGVLSSVVAAIFPQRVIECLLSVWRILSATPDPSVTTSHGTVVTGCVLIAVAAIWLPKIRHDFDVMNDSPAGNDEISYLIVADQIHDAGGTGQFISDLIHGRFPESNRNPLYLWMLSFRPEFEFGKQLCYVLAIAFLLVAVTQAAISDGWLCAGCAAVLVATNSTLGRFGATVGCEPVLVLLMGLLWCHVSRCVRGHVPESTFSELNWAMIAGALLAMLWLSKGTGLLFTAAFGVWMLVTLPFHAASSESPKSVIGKWQDRTRVWRNLRLLCVVVVTWIVVASPLLTRNQVRFGEPFYNVNSWLMFTDTYVDPVVLSERQSLDETAAEYFATHSVADLVVRGLKGMVWEAFILIRMLGPAHLVEGRFLPGLLLVFLICLGVTQSSRDERLLLGLLLVFSLPLFAWYVPVAAGERFPVPLIGPLLLFGSRGIVQFAAVTSPYVRTPTGVIAAIILSVWLVPLFVL